MVVAAAPPHPVAALGESGPGQCIAGCEEAQALPWTARPGHLLSQLGEFRLGQRAKRAYLDGHRNLRFSTAGVQDRLADLLDVGFEEPQVLLRAALDLAEDVGRHLILQFPCQRRRLAHVTDDDGGRIR